MPKQQRRFWLVNASGAVWDLTSNSEATANANFMYAPQGLGIRTRVNSFSVDNTYFVENLSTQTQTIQGVLIFYGYEHFSQFVDFVGNINTDTRLRLCYSTDGTTHATPNNKPWYKEVLITDLRKEEIDRHYAVLRVPISFTALSRWKQDIEITLELARTGTPLTFPYVYPYFFGGSNNMAVEIVNNGLPTSARIRTEGITDTPLFRLIRDGKILSQAKYHLTVGANQHLVIDSDPANQEAALYTQNGNNLIREDVYNAGEADYAFANFISIPSGTSWFLASATNANFGRVQVSMSWLKELL
ncbi:MAG: hypothetical protein FWE03_00400 [Firmicutes bacterium]|nr:hypothetical protein [Bacillota bacterium]